EAAGALGAGRARRLASAAVVGALLQTPWGEDDLPRPLLRRPARDGRVAGRNQPHALVAVLPLERGRWHLLGGSCRACLLLPGTRGCGGDQSIRGDRRRRLHRPDRARGAGLPVPPAGDDGGRAGGLKAALKGSAAAA